MKREQSYYGFQAKRFLKAPKNNFKNIQAIVADWYVKLAQRGWHREYRE